jgi:hypothetical protein
MRKLFLLLISGLFSTALWATGGDYAVSAIPANILKGANVVKRMETFRFSVTENNKAHLYRKVAYTILNEKGDKWAYYVLAYDNFRNVESFEGTLFDALGSKIKSLKKSDISDVSGSGGDAFADDNRLKWHNFYYKVFPYTVEYESEIQFKGTMFLPDWTPQERPVMGVENSELIVEMPASNPLHYKMFNYPGEPVIADTKNGRQYTWHVHNIEPVAPEFAAPAWQRITTSVFLATESFVLGDYTGSNASWKDFGHFVYDLKKDRDQLPDNIKQKVHELTDHVADRNEKIKVLYEFMQQHTRYVGVQLGVGGWQPYDAKYVGTKNYGDCKALTNYMYALLKEAGIRSVYTVINGNDNENDYLMTDLPCSQFNHAVLFVPGEKDTTWLECTSQTVSAGYMGSVSNRYALAVDENGGVLVRTPYYGLQENVQRRSSAGILDIEGNLALVVNTKYMAGQQDHVHSFVNGLSKDKLMEYLKEALELATYDVNKFDYKEEKGKIPAVSEMLDLNVSDYATVTGRRLFIVPNILSRSNEKLKDEENRKNDLFLNDAYTNIDSADIELPGGYIPESIPPAMIIATRFGKYESQVRLDDNHLHYYRRYEHFDGKFPAKDYADLVKFYDAVYKADRGKVVLVKKE